MQEAAVRLLDAVYVSNLPHCRRRTQAASTSVKAELQSFRRPGPRRRTARTATPHPRPFPVALPPGDCRDNPGYRRHATLTVLLKRRDGGDCPTRPILVRLIDR